MSASGSNLRITYTEEAEWGVPPTNPQMKVLPGVTGESLGGTQEAITSQAISAGRGTEDQMPGQKSCGGDINMEWGIKGAVALLMRGLGEMTTTGTGPYTHEGTVGQMPKPLTIEKSLTDLGATGTHYLFRGCMMNTFSLSADPAGAATGTFNFIAKGYDQSTESVDPTPTEATHAFAYGIKAAVEIGGVPYTDLSALTINGTNNLQDGRGLGSDEATRIAAGKFDISGSFTIPMTVERALPLIVKAKAGAKDTLKITFTIGTETIELFFPVIAYSGNPIPSVGSAGPVDLELNFNALIDKDSGSSTYKKSIRVRVVCNDAVI